MFSLAVAAKKVDRPEPGASQPTEAVALAFAESWRAAVGAEDCARSKTDFEVHCAGERLAAAMAPPIWFGVDVSDKDYLNDACRTWGRHRELARVDAGPGHDLMRVCIDAMMDARMTAPMGGVAFAKIAKRLPRHVRDALGPLDPTHRFVLIHHTPTSGDPNRFDLVLAITNDATGAARLTALFVQVVIPPMDGE